MYVIKFSSKSIFKFVIIPIWLLRIVSPPPHQKYNELMCLFDLFIDVFIWYRSHTINLRKNQCKLISLMKFRFYKDFSLSSMNSEWNLHCQFKFIFLFFLLTFTLIVFMEKLFLWGLKITSAFQVKVLRRIN